MLRIAVTAALTLLLAAAAPAQDVPFETWRAGFEVRLAERGAPPEVIASMMEGLEPDMRIIERDRSQPEHVRPIWEYIEGAASPALVEAGRAAQDSTHGDHASRLLKLQFGSTCTTSCLSTRTRRARG